MLCSERKTVGAAPPRIAEQTGPPRPSRPSATRGADTRHSAKQHADEGDVHEEPLQRMLLVCQVARWATYPATMLTLSARGTTTAPEGSPQEREPVCRRWAASRRAGSATRTVDRPRTRRGGVRSFDGSPPCSSPADRRSERARTPRWICQRMNADLGAPVRPQALASDAAIIEARTRARAVLRDRRGRPPPWSPPTPQPSAVIPESLTSRAAHHEAATAAA